jgi:hypothetical protein
MSYYWLELKSGKRLCIEAGSQEAARALTEHVTGERVEKVIGTLPYPAGPLVQPTDCPAFCHSPNSCVGKSCCPREYACND